MRPSISIATKLRHYSFLKNAFGIDIGNDDACLNRKGSQELIGSSNVAAYCGIIKSIFNSILVFTMLHWKKIVFHDTT